jgi:hypothetical protein
MNLSNETERMADSNWRHAQADIVEEFSRSRYQLQFQWRTETGLNRETARIFPAAIKKMGHALIKSYLDAFALENKVPEHSDEVMINKKIEVLFSSSFGLDLGALDTRSLKSTIRNIEDRAVEELHSQAHAMRLTAANAANNPTSINNTLIVNGPLTGGAQVGPNNNQNIEITDEAKSRS